MVGVMVTRTDEPLHVSEEELCRALAIVEEECAPVTGAPRIQIEERIDPEYDDEPVRTQIWYYLDRKMPTESFLDLNLRIQERLRCQLVDQGILDVQYIGYRLSGRGLRIPGNTEKTLAGTWPVC